MSTTTPRGTAMSALADDMTFTSSRERSALTRFQRQAIDHALHEDERVLAAAATELRACGGRHVSAPDGAMAVTDRRLLVVDPESVRATDSVITIPFCD